MSGEVPFEQSYRENVWRLSIGRFFADDPCAHWRRWWYKDGVLTPTREGVVIPLNRLPELHENVGLYLEQIAR
jgi:hypothetical protein